MRTKLFSIIILFATLSMACPVRVQTVAIPDDHQITPVPGKPGWYMISGGYLQDIYDQEHILLDKLQQCQTSDAGQTN